MVTGAVGQHASALADLLAAPLTDLLTVFGTGIGDTDAAALLRAGADLAEEAHTAGRCALAELAWGWTGPAAETAIASNE
ncbi:hypothetical protein Q8814_25360, partial [Rhodococcus sp. CC-R104]|nr:hypothetical protein [Rhodococcus sp. CC-R104]